MIIILAGLPGIGKTTLARELISRMHCYYFNRDHIRDYLFPEEMLDYSNEQNALASDVARDVVRYIIKKNPDQDIIIDGRPFSKNSQIAEYAVIAKETGSSLCIIHCVAHDEIIKERLLNDPSAQKTQRTWEKVKKIKQTFEPIPYQHLKLEMTDTVAKLASECLDYIQKVKKG